MSGVLGRHHVDGPGARPLPAEWDGVFTGALHRLNEAFAAAGQDCLQRSAALRQVMGA